MEHAVDWIADIDGAWVAVIHGEWSAGLAGPCSITRLVAVAHIAVEARRALGLWRVTDAIDRMARVGGAGVAVVKRGRRTRLAGPRPIAGLVAVADVRVEAGCSLRLGVVTDAVHCIAGVDCAGVGVVQRERSAGLASASAVARLVAVAHVAVQAGGALGLGIVREAVHRVAGIGRAWVAVVHGQRSARLASPRPVAGLITIAYVAVWAGCALGLGIVADSVHRMTSVSSASVAIVHDQRGSWLAGASSITGFVAVAEV